MILMINDDNDGTRASDGRGAGKTKRRVDQVPRLQKNTLIFTFKMIKSVMI